MTFGERLQALRQRAGMSQDQLAERLGVSRQAVSRWERDETMPETDKVIAMAEARDTLGMPVGEGGEMLTLETDLAADGTLTFTLPEFENDPSWTAVLLNVYWGENNAWYALAVQTGAEAPGPDQTLPMLTPGV